LSAWKPEGLAEMKGNKMKIYPTTEKVQIKWFVWSMGQRMAYESSMRGTWGFDAECSCGWGSHTGGAIRSNVVEEVRLHKIMEHNYSRLAVA
jgi:hypothetical protein